MFLGLVLFISIGTEGSGAGGIDALKVKRALRCFATSGQIMQSFCIKGEFFCCSLFFFLIGRGNTVTLAHFKCILVHVVHLMSLKGSNL